MERRRALRAPLLALVTDTGVLYAAIVAGDNDHSRCAELLAEWPEAIVVPAPVLVELDWLATTRGAHAVRETALRSVEAGLLLVEDLTNADYVHIRRLCKDYADLPLGLVDASVIAVAERLREPNVATLDHRHFAVVRPRHVRAFNLLPA